MVSTTVATPIASNKNHLAELVALPVTVPAAGGVVDAGRAPGSDGSIRVSDFNLESYIMAEFRGGERKDEEETYGVRRVACAHHDINPENRCISVSSGVKSHPLTKKENP